ncbi:MAG: RHS domain-containing protein [Desulfobacterium sp.]|nr:RHS domain-containing protein [Desulfobacterium sp.]
MMHAITHLNPVMGVDIHIIQPPGPVPPVPIPHPYVGIVFDPADYIPYIGSTISIHGLPRAIAGTAGKPVPSHIPIGGTFIKPPGNEDENFMGSATVAFDGDAASYMGLPVLSCQDVGMVPPPRTNPKKKTKVKSMVLPLSVVMPIPAGPPVLIGGPPTISLMALGMRIGMAGLGRAFRRLARTNLARRAGAALRRARQRLFRNMRPGFLKCNILKAEPVDVVTGEVVVDQQDFSIPGRIPMAWNRHYGSQSERMGVCGFGWETPADARLELEYDGSVVFHDGTGAPFYFEALPGDNPVMEPVDGGALHRMDNYYAVRLKEELTYYFPIPKEKTREVLVTYVMDRCQNSIRYVRDGNGLCSIVENSGRQIDVTSVDGRIREMGLQEHLLVRFEYDDTGDLVCVRDALNTPYRFQYNNHRLIRHMDKNGLSFSYEYDEHSTTGRCVHTWGDNGLYDYSFKFHDLEGRTEITDSLGHVFNAMYNNRYLITEEIDPLGGKTLYTYDNAGRTTSVEDPGGNLTEYVYDPKGNLLKLIQPDGNGIETEFSPANKATRITDPNGGAWHQEWDAQGLLIKQVTPLGAESSYRYDIHGQLVGFINPRKARTSLGFDGHGNLTRLTNALGHTTDFTYDALGNVVTKTDPLDQLTRYDYDPKGRLIRVVHPGGGTITCAYDPEDNLTQYQDENGAVTRMEYCGLGEIKRRLQPNGYCVEYHYDTEERLIGITNQRGEHYELKRDALGRTVEEIDYWGQGRRYTYNKAGYLKESADPLERIIHYKTDPLGRILKKLLPDPNNPEAVQTESFEYDANGNLTACENDVIRMERSFDPEGQLLQERQGDGVIVSNDYDPSGNRITRRTEAGLNGHGYSSTVHFRYDFLDQAVGVQVEGHGPIRLTRNALGRITREELGGGVRRDLSYNPDGYLTAQQVMAAEVPLFDQKYHYDRAGNLVKKQDSFFGVDRFAYDPLGRIVSHLNPEEQVRYFLNDPVGDRLKFRVTQPKDGDRASDDWHRDGKYDDVSYRFDRTGNLVQRKGAESTTHFTWDGNQRLVESRRFDKTTTYGYDPLGRRICKETAGVETHFFWDGDALLGDWNPRTREDNGKEVVLPRLREWIYYPDTFEPLVMRLNHGGAASKVYLYHNDPNGCPTRMLDSAGQVVWTAQYGAWGAVTRLPFNRVDNPIRLQGQYEDGETGLHYNRYRYYEALAGQFISPDPIGIKAGPGIYLYGRNVFRWSDPLGLTCAVTAAREAASGIPAKFKKKFECKDFANELEGRLRARGISGTRLEMKTRTGYILSNSHGNITETGEHIAIRVEDTVFDNLRPDGIPYDDWIEDLGGRQYTEPPTALISEVLF